MPKSPGVFIREKVSNVEPPLNISSAVMCIAGWTEKGPVNTPTLVSSWESFYRTFGGFRSESLVPTSVYAYFRNGGQLAYVVRIVNSTGTGPSLSAVASAEVLDAPAGNLLFTINSANEGQWANGYTVRIQPNSAWVRYVTDGSSQVIVGWDRYNVTIYNAAGVEVESYSEVNFNAQASAANDYFKSLLNEMSGVIEIEDGDVVLRSGDYVPDIFKGTKIEDKVIGTGDGTTKSFTGSFVNNVVKPSDLVIKVTIGGVEFNVLDDGNGVLTGELVDSANTNTVNYAAGTFVLNLTTAQDNGVDITISYHYGQPAYVSNETPSDSVLAGGRDGSSIAAADIISPTLETAGEGLYSIDSIGESALLNLIVPDMMDAADTTFMANLIAFADARTNIILILCPPKGRTPEQAALFIQQNDIYTDNAIYYYPWIQIQDPALANRLNMIPPVAHAAGRFAFTAAAKNISKAPAGVDDGALQFVIGVERKLSRSDMDFLYERKIAPIINTRETGIALYGARTLSKVKEWRYINVRMLFKYIELSAYEMSQWVVFENNTPALWVRVKFMFESWLNSLMLQNYFASTIATEAYFVICDDTINTSETIEAGELNVKIGIASSKPAEFVIIEVSQITSGTGA